MKKFLILFIACLAFFGCGDDVTNINGYTDEQVQAKIDSTLGAQDVVLMTDTVYQQTVDTIYNMVIDTITNELVDTIYQRVVDTVTNELVDTIYQRVVDTVMTELVDTIYNRVVDTVYKELVDTIYQKVIDTVFTELEKQNISVEIPRDTILNIYDTTDNVITIKQYNGIVYKNIFYANQIYSIAKDYFYRESAQIFEFYESPCKDGFRQFNEIDAYAISQYLNKLVSDTTLIYISLVTGESSPYGFNNITLNVAKYMVPSMVKTYHVRSTASGTNHRSPIDLPVYYMCAYDLK